jgi:hypothetical protein
MRSVWTVLAVVITGFVCGCGGPDAKVQSAVRAALAPETAHAVWAAAIKNPSLTTEDARKQIGEHNLTTFLLTLAVQESATLAQGYSWQYGAVRPDVLAQYLTDNSTLVAAKHTSNLQWAKQPDGTLSGSLAVNTPYGLTATLLFAATEKDGSVVVTRLAIAKKDSTALTDGFTVFTRQ